MELFNLKYPIFESAARSRKEMPRVLASLSEMAIR
jgi:hypothetical protein